MHIFVEDFHKDLQSLLTSIISKNFASWKTELAESNCEYNTTEQTWAIDWGRGWDRVTVALFAQSNQKLLNN